MDLLIVPYALVAHPQNGDSLRVVLEVEEPGLMRVGHRGGLGAISGWITTDGWKPVTAETISYRQLEPTRQGPYVKYELGPVQLGRIIREFQVPYPNGNRQETCFTVVDPEGQQSDVLQLRVVDLERFEFSYQIPPSRF